MDFIGDLFGFIFGLIKLAIFLAIVMAAVAFWGYNSLRRLSESAKEALANIGVATRKQTSLINQLIEATKGYQESEKLVMLKVSEDMSVASIAGAQQQASAVMATLGQMANRYPELKADQQYTTLMASMKAAEDNVEKARLHYNDQARQFNTQRSSIPHVFYSKLLGFGEAPYLTEETMGAPEKLKSMGFSDDGERLNQLFKTTTTATLEAGKAVGSQARLLVERSADKLKQVSAGPVFHYFDEMNQPHGPVSLDELAQLARQGAVQAETKILRDQDKTWTTVGSLMSS